MQIREAMSGDFEAIWPILKEIVRSGEFYAYDRETTYEEAFGLWMTAPHKTYVVENEGDVLGSYFIKANQAGPGSHVCNCGYMVSSLARGKGLATLMCVDSQKIAVELGYKAMQFNMVVSRNEVAVQLWHKLGFETVGRLPKAFDHPRHGLVDGLVMYKWLADDA
ncbi:GNAT family N-acetyltransferase [Paremcibacter congregatus]|uniref:GNAT family N-acetyltransferase n=1 Tax=Paremcibacter congregatus TaxID=2043170 RepID=A0A2G4YUE0_9PROT|nr:GNAT family N-acetyltransferase [Paremcibacter congregatus]PHZ85954.1 GNAT family N-acetyltransferase [Paremcibacter congregatus]QDE26919.1 GNAT family N-acetyltransferase [Paremcibacter congregatus]